MPFSNCPEVFAFEHSFKEPGDKANEVGGVGRHRPTGELPHPPLLAGKKSKEEEKMNREKWTRWGKFHSGESRKPKKGAVEECDPRPGHGRGRLGRELEVVTSAGSR